MLINHTFFVDPNYDLISSRLGGLGDDFMKAVYSEGYTPEETKYRRKYPNNPKPSISTANVEELIRAGEVGHKLKIF